VATAIFGGSQNFLDSSLISMAMRFSPRRSLALRILDFSPHYFFRTPENQSLAHFDYLEYEFERNRASRQRIVETMVVPFLGGDEVVLDYGCGPGFLARAALSYASRIHACDISQGVLACAAAINPGPSYCLISSRGRIPLEDRSVDLIYSFAVIQHLTDQVFKGVLTEWQRVLKPGGKVLCHVILSHEGWRTENQWRADNSLRGRAKWALGLHCFARSEDSISEMAMVAGFSRPDFRLVSELAPDLNDLTDQYLCSFSRLE
jgi:SAM-dependent methyltransferase